MLFLLISLSFLHFVSAVWTGIDVFCYADKSDLFEFKVGHSLHHVDYEINECYELYNTIWFKQDLLGEIATYTDSKCTNKMSAIDIGKCVQNDAYQINRDPGTSNSRNRNFKECWDRNFKFYGFSNPKNCINHTIVEYSQDLHQINKTFRIIELNYMVDFENTIEEELTSVCQQQFDQTNTNLISRLNLYSNNISINLDRYLALAQAKLDQLESNFDSSTSAVTISLNGKITGIITELDRMFNSSIMDHQSSLDDYFDRINQRIENKSQSTNCAVDYNRIKDLIKNNVAGHSCFFVAEQKNIQIIVGFVLILQIITIFAFLLLVRGINRDKTKDEPIEMEDIEDGTHSEKIIVLPPATNPDAPPMSQSRDEESSIWGK